MEEKIVAAYWYNKLAGRKGINTHSPREGNSFGHHRSISAADLAKFRDIAGSNKSAALVIFLTVYHIVLRRYFRHYGNFITIPGLLPDERQLWFVLPSEQRCNLREMLMQVKDEVHQVLIHKNYDGEKLLEKLAAESLPMPGFVFQWRQMTSEATDQEPLLVLSVDEQDDDTVKISIHSLSSFVDPFVAKAFLEDFAQVLTTFHLDLDKQVIDLCRSSSPFVSSNDIELVPSTTLYDLFREKVGTCGGTVAVVEGDRKLTFSELDNLVNDLAWSLYEECGIQRGDVVGVMIPKSVDAIISILAILRCGAAYLPIDIEYPQARKEYIISNSGLKVILKNGEDFRKTHAATFYNINNAFRNKLKPGAVPAMSNPDDLAYIIYTSGSTGKPKGAMIAQKGVVNMCLAQIETFQITQGTRVVWFASFSFDASVSEIFMALCAGGTLLIPDSNTVSDRHLFVDFLKRSAADVVTLPPSYLDLLSEQDLGSLKAIITAGEAANPSKAYEVSRTRRYYNAYGPTECSVCVSLYKVDGVNPYTKKIPIGKPLKNIHLHVLDEHQRSVPAGVEGVIHVSGIGIGLGYVNNTALTQERFIVLDGVPMYNTGDVGRILPDGNVEFIGRYDTQLKIRGYRIEIEEIDQALLSLPHVQSATVVPEKRSNGEVDLHAFIISDHHELEPIVRALRDLIPSYMVPQHFHFVAHFPKTINGKVDKQKTLDSIAGKSDNRLCVSTSGNEIEQKLASIWKMTLGIPRVLPNDNFFEAGGHSIRAIRLLNEIEKQFSVRISFSTLLREPTFDALSQMVQGSSEKAFFEIPRINSSESYISSSSQRRLWVLSQMPEISAAYNMVVMLQIDGQIDIDKLEQSFASVIDRHESLRTVFRQNSEGEIQQVVLQRDQLNFTLHRVDASKDIDQESTVAKCLKTESLKTFDLSAGPLIRVTVVTTRESKHVLFCCIHHIISDGWSLGVLLQDVFAVYSDLVQGRKPALRPLTIQHRDFVAWQHTQHGTDRFAHDKAYWKNQFLESVPVLELPCDHVRPAMKSYNGGRVSRQIAPSLVSKIKTYCQQQHTTFFIGLVSIVKGLLYRYTMQEDIVVGTVSAGRDHPDLHEQIGCFINTLPLRTRFSGSDTFSELLGKVNTVTLEAFEHQYYPFELIVNEAESGREMSRHALFDVTVVLQNGGLNLQQLPEDLKVSVYKTTDGFSSKFDLSFDFTEDADGLNLIVEYSTDLFERDTVERLIQHFCQLAQQLVSRPDIPLSTIDYLSGDEKAQLLLGLNDNCEFDRQATIIDLFEEQVALNADRIAVKFGEKELSYRKVNELANQLGSYLRSTYQIAADDRIALKLPRNEWMIISMLAVLKAGGGYVPIDPDYPEERIAYMLSDSGAKVLIDEQELSSFQSQQGKWYKDNLPAINTPNHLAYVIYTSGTTGQPKGVMIEHRNVVHFNENLSHHWSLTAGLKMGATTNLTFDISVLEILSSLMTGLQVTLFSNTEPEVILGAIEGRTIDALQVTPSRLNLLLEATPDALTILDKLEVLLIGGEPMTQRMFDAMRTLCHTKVYNVYGPTETTIWSTCAELRASDKLSIGKALIGERVYLLSQANQLVPPGIKGEICISGKGVARGYLNRDELTESRFVPDPFVPGAKMYRTGDLGRWLNGGVIGFSGRKDGQLKIRGHRIEPGEVQNALSKHPSVEACVVTSFTGMAAEDRLLVAFYVSRSSAEITDLGHHLSKILPTYMIPSHFIHVAALPLNASGKVDVKSLQAQLQGAMRLSQPIAPTSPIQEQLLEIWKEILLNDNIGVRENFFAEGGNSLKAIKLLNQIHIRMGVQLQIKDVFLNPTVEALGDHITVHQWMSQSVDMDCVDNSNVIEI